MGIDNESTCLRNIGNENIIIHHILKDLTSMRDRISIIHLHCYIY